VSPTAIGHVDQGPESIDGHVDFGLIIRRWERLHLYYNALLTAVVLLLTILVFPRHLVDLRFWASVVFDAIIANRCFIAVTVLVATVHLIPGQ
jgi:hypothetical protein